MGRSWMVAICLLGWALGGFPDPTDAFAVRRVVKGTIPRRGSPVVSLGSRRDNDDDDDGWPRRLTARLERANKGSIARDALVACAFVMGRFGIYEALGTAGSLGWTIEDWVYLTGTLSSAVVLVCYWTAAGLLSRGFEDRMAGLAVPQVLVGVALSCPIWLATEHWLRFGPPDVGGSTLGEAIGTGFVGLAAAMMLGRALAPDRE